jgi:hypothetical protein
VFKLCEFIFVALKGVVEFFVVADHDGIVFAFRVARFGSLLSSVYGQAVVLVLEGWGELLFFEQFEPSYIGLLLFFQPLLLLLQLFHQFLNGLMAKLVSFLGLLISLDQLGNPFIF